MFEATILDKKKQIVKCSILRFLSEGAVVNVNGCELYTEFENLHDINEEQAIEHTNIPVFLKKGVLIPKHYCFIKISVTSNKIVLPFYVKDFLGRTMNVLRKDNGNYYYQINSSWSSHEKALIKHLAALDLITFEVLKGPIYARIM